MEYVYFPTYCTNNLVRSITKYVTLYGLSHVYNYIDGVNQISEIPCVAPFSNIRS